MKTVTKAWQPAWGKLGNLREGLRMPQACMQACMHAYESSCVRLYVLRTYAGITCILMGTFNVVLILYFHTTNVQLTYD